MALHENALLQQVLEIVKEKEGEKILACADAFRLAEQQAVAVGEIGRICNSNRIKIARCQLGCF